jgi:hypothetical protein
MWSFLDYRYRLANAIKGLEERRQELRDGVNANPGHPVSESKSNEIRRLDGKIEGVKLALSYFDEMTKERGFTDGV